MTPEQFVYWLRGVLELGERALSKEEVEVISRHLSTVFIEKAKHTPPISKTKHVPMTPQEWDQERASIEEEIRKLPFDPRGQVYCAPLIEDPASVEGAPTFVSNVPQSIAEATEAMKEWGVYETTIDHRAGRARRI